MITSIHGEVAYIAPCSLKTARVTTAGKLTRCSGHWTAESVCLSWLLGAQIISSATAS